MAAPPIVAAAADGTFFLAAPPRTGGQERIYRFCLTGSGQVTGFSAVPGGELPAGQYVDALAATPDGSQLAAGATFAPPPPPRHTANGTIMYATLASDEIFVINTATGARSAWDGGKAGLAAAFQVASLSWAGDGRQLVVLEVWCTAPGGYTEECTFAPSGHGRFFRTAEVWALDLGSGNGGSQAGGGHLLLRQSARRPASTAGSTTAG